MVCPLMLASTLKCVYFKISCSILYWFTFKKSTCASNKNGAWFWYTIMKPPQAAFTTLSGCVCGDLGICRVPLFDKVVKQRTVLLAKKFQPIPCFWCHLFLYFVSSRWISFISRFSSKKKTNNVALNGI